VLPTKRASSKGGQKMSLSERIRKCKNHINTKDYYERRLGHQINLKRRYKCPFCASNHGFGLYWNGEEYKHKCHSCEREGDIIDCESQIKGIDKPTTQQIKEALQTIEDEYGLSTTTTSYKSTPKKSANLKLQEPIKEKIHWEEIINQLDGTALNEELENLFASRNFGKYTQKATEIARNYCLGIYQNRNFAFPVLNESGEICGLHLRSLPNKKEFKGFAEGSEGKGYLFFDRHSEIVFIVEGILKAIAATCLDYSAFCTYGSGNVDYCLPIAQKLCPNNRLVLWLDSGTEEKQKKAMEQYGIEGIFWKDAPKKNYGLDDLLAQDPYAFATAVNEYMNQLPKRVDHIEISSMEKAITHEPKVFNLIKAYTGVGKTKEMIQQLLQHLRHEEKAVALANTINNAENLDAEVRKDATIDQCKRVAFVCANQDKESKKAKEASGLNEVKQVNISTYGYLGFNGHKPYIFATAGYDYLNARTGKQVILEGLTTTDYLYCDEFHQLFEFCRVQYALAQMYVRKESNVVYWEKIDEYPNWQKWVIAYHPTMKTWNKFEYPDELPEETINRQTTPKSLDFIGKTFSELQDPKKYRQVFENLFAIKLEQKNISLEIPAPPIGKDRQKTQEYDYLSTLSKFLYSPQILTEFPIKKETGEPLGQAHIDQMFSEAYKTEIEKAKKRYPDNEEKAKKTATDTARNLVNQQIKFPANAPYIPHLCGYNTLQLIQMMKYTRISINALSATIEEKEKKILQYVCNLCGWHLQEIFVTEVPFNFHLHTLQMEEKISYTNQATIIKRLIDTKLTKTLCVVWKKTNAQTVYRHVKRTHREISLFKERDYETAYLETKGDKTNIVTYPKASILQGENMPEHNNVIIDCGIFIRRIALDLDIDITYQKKDVLQKLAQYIGRHKLQIIGRLLREDNKKREKGKTITSEKIITIFCHNLAEELQNFTIDPNLIASHTRYVEKKDERFYSKLPNYLAESIVNAINNIQQGKKIENWAQRDAEIQCKDKKNLMYMSKTQREAVKGGNWLVAKDGNRFKSLVSKGIELKKNGKKWREIYDLLHLNRYKHLMEAVRRELGF
jgi:hypothetical protein